MATSTITTGDTTDGSTTTGDTTDGSSDTSGGGPCAVVHHGNLVVKKDTDLAPLADIGHVTGTVYISMYGRDQPDLSFLSCLHTIGDGLWIQNNALLESTKGLENLQSVLRIFVFDNGSLRSIEGIGPITDVFSLVIDVNPSLEEIHLNSLQTIGLLQVGHCHGEMASAKHEKLISLPGFSGLTSVESLILEGNTALMTADILDILATNGGAQPLSFATVRYNLLLPEADVHAKLDTLGLDMQHRDVCGNAEGDPECFCVVG